MILRLLREQADQTEKLPFLFTKSSIWIKVKRYSVEYQCNQKLLHHYQHAKKQLNSYIQF